MHNLPTVAIVGRMNVGKSTLFNRLIGAQKTMAFDYAGVTRDFIADTMQWQGRSFTLVDTGGIRAQTISDTLQEAVRTRAFQVMSDADVVVFVMDGAVGPVLEDQELASVIRKLQKPVIVAVNKVDTVAAEEYVYSFQSLGFKNIIGISAQHGRGIAALLDAILEQLPLKGSNKETAGVKAAVVLLGKPNVGKSSLMNALLEKERMIVSDIPGTTREAVSEHIRFYQETIQLTDTPGVRRKSSVKEDLEQLMVKSSFRAVKHADIVLLMIDGSAGELSDQELKLAFFAFEQGKGLILLINKEDLVTEELRASFDNQAPLYRHLLQKVPRLYISAQTKKNIGKILPLVDAVYKRYTQQLDSHQLTVDCKEWLAKTPLYVSTNQLLVREAQQIGTKPPTICMYVNNPLWFDESQRAFFENKMRKKYDLLGVPVRFLFRRSKK
ncbi:MAG: ribosome biogenesis GTPase Der [Candidatus Babeliales bacterium]